jgi:hypothetical protein
MFLSELRRIFDIAQNSIRRVPSVPSTYKVLKTERLENSKLLPVMLSCT